MLQLKGKIKLIKEVQQITDTFKKREFVITDDSSQYPQHILFQITQDKCNLIDGYAVGQEITAFFNLRGREWTSPQGEVRYFNTLEAWKITTEQATASAVAATPAPAPATTTPPPETGSADDLPF